MQQAFRQIFHQIKGFDQSLGALAELAFELLNFGQVGEDLPDRCFPFLLGFENTFGIPRVFFCSLYCEGG